MPSSHIKKFNEDIMHDPKIDIIHRNIEREKHSTKYLEYNKTFLKPEDAITEDFEFSYSTVRDNETFMKQ